MKESLFQKKIEMLQVLFLVEERINLETIKLNIAVTECVFSQLRCEKKVVHGLYSNYNELGP